jgi:glycosyltransferase involved in cell wall biosynthesis
MEAVICISEATRESAVSELGLKEGRCITIPPPIPRTGVPNSIPSALVDQTGDQTSYLLHVGVLTPRKNPKVLLQAFARVLENHRDLELWCVGPYQVNPTAAAIVAQMAKTLGIDHRVSVLGDVTDSDLVGLYRHCSAFVFPSLAEGFGYPVIEAISNHAPCVLGDIPALHEAAGSLAWYADPTSPAAFAAAIEDALGSKWRLDRDYWEAADAWIERFSRLEIGARLLAAYRSAIRVDVV